MPAPLGPESFEPFPLSPPIREALAARGYAKPMPVQTAVMAPALAGRDLVVQAQTGSGKTAAFGVPILEKLVTGAAKPGFPHALVLAPTRELALQVAEELRALGQKKGIKVVAIYGGVPLGRQVSGLKGAPEVVVGTPGRLLDHLRRGTLGFAEIKTVVLDEADEMLSMGFWEEVTEIMSMTPQSRQTMLFSATLPYEVMQVASQYLREPERIDVSGQALTVDGIENCVYHVLSEVPKPRQLLYVLETERPTSTIVFCNTRNEAEMIGKFLSQSGFVAEALTGSFRQRERERIMQRIKTGELKYMVATDVVARGIDIADLSHVVNYSLPEFSEVYLHRVGRTGRIGKSGMAISLVDGKGLGTMTTLERQFNVRFVERTLPPEAEVLRLRSQRVMKELSEKASVAEVGQHVSVAQDIIAAADGAQIIAFLLKSYFNTRAEGEKRPLPENGARPSNPQPQQHRAPEAGQDQNFEASGRRRGRRRRRRRRGEGPGQGEGDNYRGGDVVDAFEILSGDRGRGEPMPDVERMAPEGAPAAVSEGAPQTAMEGTPAPMDGAMPPVAAMVSDHMTRLRVNIGFDDGFRGRGSVAKKISALAGLNDGIVMEVESRRDYAVLKASPEIAELVIERVDGAQLGKKIITVAFAS